MSLARNRAYQNKVRLLVYAILSLMIATYSCQGCPSGQYNVSASVCAPCDIRCSTCTGAGVDNCDGCRAGDNRELVGNTCSCKAGFFEVNSLTAVCSTCNSKCKTCFGTATNCTSCYGSSEIAPIVSQFRYLSSHSCICIDGYFDNNADVCVICHYACSTCVGLARNCTLCSSANRQYLPYCDCKTGYYEKTLDAPGCAACDTKCASCRLCVAGDSCAAADESICTSCAGLNRVAYSSSDNQADSCRCESGYYLNSPSDLNCTVCPYNCETCIKCLTNVICLTCKGTNRNSTTTQSCVDGSNTYTERTCACNNGTYNINNVPNCATCPSKCFNCTASGATCISCIGLQRNTSNYCLCNTGYQEPASGDDCVLVCDETEFRNASNNCACNTTYFSASNTGACSPCTDPCETCSGSATNCLTCKSSLPNRNNNPPYCSCLDGYYLNTGVCTACNTSKCGTCVTSENNCLTCTGVGRSTPPSCGCDPGYIEVSGVCEKCHYTCSTCSGVASTECLGCVDTTTRNFASNTCLCKDGYFEVGNFKCNQCDYYCETCEDYPQKCLTCNDNTKRDIANQCRCTLLAGFYDDGSSAACQACNSSCLNCTGTATNCTSCADNRRAPPDCACAEGFYADGSNVCQPCTAPCKTCSVLATNCTSCLDSLYRKNDSACTCQDGYTLSSGVCTACDPKCLNCSASVSTCDSCKGLYRNLANSCNCMDGYYQYGTEQDCRKCLYRCKTCTSGTACTSVNTGTNRDAVTHLCNDGYFDLDFTEICVQCNTVLCAKCVGTSTNCTECSDTVARNLSNGCACSSGYYLSGSTCLNCKTSNPKCETCTSSTVCTTCNTLHTNRNISNNCECNEGYFQNATNQCQQCHYRCKTCSGGNTAAHCTTCQDPANRDATQPCACKQGYFDDGSSALCKQCAYKCLNCSALNTCTGGCSDAATRTLGNNCACNTGYFDAGVAVCPQCNYKCASCDINATNCLTCSTNRNISSSCACNQGRVEVSQVCELCMDYCDGCIGTRTNCTRCLGTNRNTTAPDCACLDGFYDNPSDGSPNCLACSKQCLTCSIAASNCTICKTNGTNRLGNAPTCGCHPLFYENATDTVGKCAECPRKCATCDTSEVCTACIHSTTRSSTAPACSCLTGYLDTGLKDCLKCHAKCTNCNTNVDTCTTCTASHAGTRSTSLPCSCLTKFYEVGLAACAACAFQCADCSTISTNCTTCIVGANRESAPSCKCVVGTYEGGFNYCSECALKCESTDGCNNAAQCKGKCSPNRNSSNSCSCNTGYHDFTLGQHNLGLQGCKLDCTQPDCELLTAKYTVTDDIAQQIFSHYSFSREDNIYNTTYIQVYAMGFLSKIRIFGISKSTTTPTNTEIIKFDSADYTGSTIASLCYVRVLKKLVAGATAKLFVIDLVANTTAVVTTFGSLTISTITHIMNINATDSVIFSSSNGYLVWYNLTSSAIIQSYLVKTGLSILKFDSDSRNIWMAGDDKSIYVQSILRPASKSVLKTNHTSEIKNIHVTSKYVVSVSEEEFIIHELQTQKLISWQLGGGIYSDKIPGSDVIAILHTSPIIDFQVYNLTDFSILQTLYQKRQKIYEFNYEKDGQMIGPFYDKKIGVQLGTTKYSTYASAKAACEADISCKSIYYHQDNNRLTDVGQFWILSAETAPSDLTAPELAENEVRKVYIKQNNANNYMFYSKSSSYFLLKTQIPLKTLFVDVCGANLNLEVRPNYFYQGLCTSACRGEGEPDYLQFNKFCSNRCSSGFTFSSNVCTKCPHKCALECDQSLNCLDGCKGNRLFNSSCSCPAGSFEDGVRELCQVCQPKCETCSTNSSNCLSCAKNRKVVPDCQCNEGFFDDNKTAACIPCFSDLCAKCKNSGANQCLQCKSGYYFSPESESSDQGTCYEECPDGFKEDKDNMICKPSDGISKEAVTIIVLGTVVTALIGTTSVLLVKTGFIGAKAVASQLGTAQAYSKVAGQVASQANNLQATNIDAVIIP